MADTLLDNPTVPYNKTQLTKHAEVFKDSLYRRCDNYLELGLVERTEVESGSQYWTLNPDSEISNALSKIIHLTRDDQTDSESEVNSE